MNKIIKVAVSFMMVACLASLMDAQNVYAKSKNRHEYCWFEYVSPKSGGGWNIKNNKIKVKIQGNKIIVRGRPYKSNALDSGTATYYKKLNCKKRIYKITKKTQFFSLHWSSAIKISKKEALSGIRKKHYGGFQIQYKGKKIIKLYMLNHGA